MVSAPIEMTFAIYSLSMNLMLYAFKKPWFNHPHQSLTTTSSILLIILLLILFLSIITHHILTSTLTLLFLVLCYEPSFNVGLPLFMTHSPPTLCMTCNTHVSVPNIQIFCCTAARTTAFPHLTHLSRPPRLNNIFYRITIFPLKQHNFLPTTHTSFI